MTVDEVEARYLDQIQDILGNLAGHWRYTKSPDTAKKYQLLLTCLIEMGWTGGMDLDDQLPPELMPQRYSEYINDRRKKRRNDRVQEENH